MSRPIIGITLSLEDTGKIRKGVRYGICRSEYGEQVRKAGGEPLYLDYSIDPAIATRLCDGILISGGEDIDPAFYGQAYTYGNLLGPRDRTVWEHELIDSCDWAGVPILGVCYGMQLLNVHYGGSLYQDLERERSGSLHHGSSEHNAMHDVVFHADSLGFTHGETARTAHRHSQAVDSLAPGFTIAATAPDGTVEAIAGRGHIGVQWHAEHDGTAGHIYGSFIAAAQPRAEATQLSDFLPEPAAEAI